MSDPEKVTLSGQPADPVYAGGAPQPIDPATGMHKDYWVLSEAERAKGFVRPVRTTYTHVGQRPRHPTRLLTPEEREEFKAFGYAFYEKYPESEAPVNGRYWTEAQLRSGCGRDTTMGDALAETYARDPKFYGATFCATCRQHYPVGEHGEFVWAGTNERVGT